MSYKVKTKFWIQDSRYALTYEVMEYLGEDRNFWWFMVRKTAEEKDGVTVNLSESRTTRLYFPKYRKHKERNGRTMEKIELEEPLFLEELRQQAIDDGRWKPGGPRQHIKATEPHTDDENLPF